MTNNTRNNFLDFSRGVTVFLMILGHCIQNGNGKFFLEKQLFWNDYFFKFIYSFHMPLFALISGYFLNFSTSKYSLKEGIIRKLNYLLFPIIFFGIYRYFLNLYFVLKDESTFKLKDFILSILQGYWFLWGILYLSIIVFIIKYLFFDNIKVYFTLFFVLLLVPNEIHNIKLSTILFLYPFMLIGYFFSKYQEVILKVIKENKKFILLILLLFFFLQFLFFNKESYIYISGLNITKTKLKTSVIRQIFIDLFRINIGLTGSCFILLILDEISKSNKLKKIYNIFIYLGQNSLSFYCLQELLIVYLLVPFTINYQKNYKINFLQAIIVIILCYFIDKILKRYTILKKIHFGI